MVRKKVSSKKSLIKKNSANKVVSRKKSHKSSVKKVLPRHELHPLPKWLEVIEHINASLIPPAVLALGVIIIVELFFELHSHFWEEVIHVADIVIISIFVIDLCFIFYHVRNWKIFFRDFWLDILAVFPFIFMFRAAGTFVRFFRILRFGETAIVGQTILHEGLEVRKAASAAARSQKFAKYVRMGSRSVRVLSKSRFFAAFKKATRRK